MFATPPPGVTRPSTYEALRNSKAITIVGDEHDVFGDGTVIIKAARGHTQGHQVLYVRLPRTGGVVLAGDLYHYQAERTLDRVPTFEFDAQQTRAARKTLDRFLQETNAQMWIQHDFNAHAKLRKAPEYYSRETGTSKNNSAFERGGPVRNMTFIALVGLMLFGIRAQTQVSVDKWFDSNGVRIRYVESGTGVPVVLVHGYTRSIESN